MGKRIVIALGGNALGNNLPEQMIAVKQTAKAIVDLIQEGHEVIIAHGNGPQVGMIQKAMAELTRSEPEKYIPCPLSVCVAMSQGYIGYDLQNALREELLDRGINKGVATVLTQVEVDPEDKAFQNPTKPIGAFMTKEEADKMVAERAMTSSRTPAGATAGWWPLPSPCPSWRSSPSGTWWRPVWWWWPAAAAAFPSLRPRGTT